MNLKAMETNDGRIVLLDEKATSEYFKPWSPKRNDLLILRIDHFNAHEDTKCFVKDQIVSYVGNIDERFNVLVRGFSRHLDRLIEKSILVTSLRTYKPQVGDQYLTRSGSKIVYKEPQYLAGRKLKLNFLCEDDTGRKNAYNVHFMKLCHQVKSNKKDSVETKEPSQVEKLEKQVADLSSSVNFLKNAFCMFIVAIICIFAVYSGELIYYLFNLLGV